ncbi:MAG: CPBP family intramembrane metalloprotease [Chloroflexi bacterium]|nr:CPBP family intramembrane metalloprotease [Chloroflexota bacterium]
MNKLKNFALEHPLLFSILATFAGIFLTEIPFQDFLAPYLEKQTAFYLTIIFEQGLVGFLCLLMLASFGWLEIAGITPPKKWRALWLGWPLLLFTLINMDEGVVIDTSKPMLIVLHLLTALSTGWVEELLCRGVVTVTFLQKWGRSKKGIYFAVLASSLLFGLAHLANFIQGRKPLLNNVTQIIFSLFFGVIFAACMLRNRSIWPMMILHAAVDWAGTLREVAVGGGLRTVPPAMSPTNALISILITLPLFLYGLFLLRKVEPDSLPLETLQNGQINPSPKLEAVG